MLPPLCYMLEHLCSLACSRVIWSPIAPVIEVDVHWPWLNWPNSLTEHSIQQGRSPATDQRENQRFPLDPDSANRPIYTLSQHRHGFLSRNCVNCVDIKQYIYKASHPQLTHRSPILHLIYWYQNCVIVNAIALDALIIFLFAAWHVYAKFMLSVLRI